jgi:cell wall-associated NlpC family hydrolase
MTAMGFLGVPYRRGGNNASTGFDCSGFVRSMYERTIGLVLPRLAKDQAAATQPIEKKELQPGDLVFFNTMKRAFSHVGIYVGDGKFIHSPKPGAQVRVEDMQQNYWARRFDGARRVVAWPSEPVAAPAATLP